MSLFAEKLQDLLYDNNLTYKNLAKSSDISRTKLYFWLEHNIVPTTQSMIQVARHFQCPMDFFLGRTEKTKIIFIDYPVSFSERLRALIQEKNITAYRACMQLHIKTAMICDWLNNGTLPNYDNLLLLTDYFDCPADYLLGLSDDR